MAVKLSNMNKKNITEWNYLLRMIVFILCEDRYMQVTPTLTISLD